MYRVNELPEMLQPRAQVRSFGVNKVGPDVLLAILLRKGVPGRNALETAHDLLQVFGSLEALSVATWQTIVAKHIPGVGEVAAMIIASAFELEWRAHDELLTRPLRELHSAADVAELLCESCRGCGQESMFVLPLDSGNRMLSVPVVIAKGRRHGVDFDVGQVFETILRFSTDRAILAHNHPSGDPSPSSMDLIQTRRLLEAARVLNVTIVDHVVIGDSPERYFSICESGLVQQ